MRLATTTGDFNHYTNSGLSPAEAIRQYEGTGFQYLDYNFYDVIFPGSPFLGDGWMDQVKEAADTAAALGMTFVQAHSPNYNPLDPKFDHETGMLALYRTIEACAYLGIPNVVVHSGDSPNITAATGREAFFRENRIFYEKLFPYMEKFGVNVLVENGAYVNAQGKFHFFDAQDMVDFLEEIGHPMLKACWDTGHANLNKFDQYQHIVTLGKHAAAFHMQDNFGYVDEHIFPMMGTIDWDSIMQALQAIGFNGYFTLESPHSIRRENEWPHFRQSVKLPAPSRLRNPSVELQRHAIGLLYQIGKFILEQYNCFEE